ncbi:tRNA pseudouridine(55) synthase TruB [Porphyromonas gingivalis]|uniref:tRNA pseudouridine(55) synthase TruB n=1 Tax=Porphyromonas gingivalis TaxID=837 RepID=UPI000C1A4C46|nr:tRNA pseudouridine(55) synthase TruB [Porphyromonas gingivalis]ATR92974.1 tRNA pseudouridine(55) synthase TruB [Porphyromonas gingivalis]ATS07979.1 tRNA pseudouridine(55) synthase TruB [Porphyromonas gingivalis]
MKQIDRPLHLREGEVLYFDKPLTWTSFDLVNKFRYRACRRMGIKKLRVGHAGTLDPLASGVMILCTGRATKQIDVLQAGTKEYIATIRLGATTPSFDKETEPDAFFPYEHITRQSVLDILPRFTGTIEQVPPIFSAVRVNGKRAYDLARKGKEVEMKTRTLQIDEIELLEYALPLITLRIVCSKGTYIRALARDIATALESGGHLEALHRTRVGDARIEDCLSMDELEQWFDRLGFAYELEFEQKEDNPSSTPTKK